MTTAFIEAGVTTLTFVAIATGGYTTAQIVVPGSAQAGDLAILQDVGWQGTVSINTPAGWTFIDDAIDFGLGTPSSRLSYKILASGDIGNTVTGITALRTVQHMVIYRPDDDIEDVSFTTPNSFAGVANPSAQNVLAGAEAAPGVVIGAWFDTNPSQLNLASSPGFDAIQSFTNVIGGGGSVQLGYKKYDVSPADHSISATGSGSRHLQSFYIRVE